MNQNEIFLIIILIAFIIFICYFIYKYIKAINKIKELKRELNMQDLDYHLRKIKEMGYDFSIKAGSSGLQKSKNATQKNKKSENKKHKSFDELIDTK